MVATTESSEAANLEGCWFLPLKSGSEDDGLALRPLKLAAAHKEPRPEAVELREPEGRKERLLFKKASEEQPRGHMPYVTPLIFGVLNIY
jgi:hypothetical protein